MRVIYNLQDSITVLADGKVRLQPRNTAGARVTITDELANHPQVVSFSVNRRVSVMTLEESAVYEAQRARTEVAYTPPVEPAHVVEIPKYPTVVDSVVTPPAVLEVVKELPAVPPAVAPPVEAHAETLAEGDSTDTTEKDSADSTRRRSRRR